MPSTAQNAAWLDAAACLQQLARELEGGGLEVDAARAVAEHEAEVDVDQVPRLVHQDVAIVAVLDLHRMRQYIEECHKEIGVRTTSEEVPFRTKGGSSGSNHWHLQEVGNQAVSRHALDEGPLRFRPLRRPLQSASICRVCQWSTTIMQEGTLACAVQWRKQ